METEKLEPRIRGEKQHAYTAVLAIRPAILPHLKHGSAQPGWKRSAAEQELDRYWGAVLSAVKMRTFGGQPAQLLVGKGSEKARWVDKAMFEIGLANFQKTTSLRR